MSVHTRKKVPPHKHASSDVYDVIEVRPNRPAYRGVHSTDVVVDSTLTLTDYINSSTKNEIANPSFEQGNHTWGGDEESDLAQQKFGMYSAKLTASGSDVTSGESNLINVKGQAIMIVGVWAKITSRTAGTFRLELHCYESDGTTETGVINIDDLTATQDWTLHTKTIEDSDLPADTVYVVARFRWLTTPTGVAYVDGWCLNFGKCLASFKDLTGTVDNTDANFGVGTGDFYDDKLGSRSTQSLAWVTLSEWNFPAITGIRYFLKRTYCQIERTGGAGTAYYRVRVRFAGGSYTQLDTGNTSAAAWQDEDWSGNQNGNLGESMDVIFEMCVDNVDSIANIQHEEVKYQTYNQRKKIF